LKLATIYLCKELLSLISIVQFQKKEKGNFQMLDRLNTLSNRDKDILEALWGASTPLTASQIIQSNPELRMTTVQSVLRKLLNKNIIAVADIVHSGTVLSRRYKPNISAEEFTIAQLQELGKKISKTNLMTHLLDAEKNPKKVMEEIRQLEAMLEEYKKKL